MKTVIVKISCFITVIIYFILINNTSAKQSKRIEAGSTDDSILFFSYKNPIGSKVKTLKIFTPDCHKPDTNSCFVEFTFDNGLLKKELSFDDYKPDIKTASELAYIYLYRNRNKSGKRFLAERIGDAYNGPSQLDNFEVYEYLKDRLDSKEYTFGTYHDWQKRAITKPDVFKEKTRYIYNLQGRLDHIETLDEEKNLTVEYYIYEGNKLIGFFPSPDRGQNPLAPPLYFLTAKKKSELMVGGFIAFRNKYLSSPLFKKLVENSYTPITRKRILINSRPANEFLKTEIGKDYKYLIFEISENRFLFYKLID